MKLLVLSYDYYPDLSLGSTRTASLIEHLLKMQRSDIKIDLITTMPHRFKDAQAVAAVFEQQDHLRIRRVPVPKDHSSLFGQAWAFFCYARAVRKLVRYHKYKVVYASSSRLMMASLATWIAKSQHAILFLDIRNLFADTLKDSLPKQLYRYIGPILSKMEHWTLSSADHVNILSKGFEPYMQQRFPNKKLTCYTNGIDRDLLQRGFKTTSQASEQFNLLYIGNVGDAQGLERIIPQLAKSLEGCAQIKIVGDGSKKVHLEAAIQALNCKNVTLLPTMPRDKLFQLYAQADMLFLHLKESQAFRNTLPSKIFEYAATGKPILAGVGGFVAEFIQSEISNAVVFRPYDAEDALKEIAKLNFVLDEREDFIKKYQRDAIMKNMAGDLLGYFSLTHSK